MAASGGRSRRRAGFRTPKEVVASLAWGIALGGRFFRLSIPVFFATAPLELAERGDVFPEVARGTGNLGLCGSHTVNRLLRPLRSRDCDATAGRPFLIRFDQSDSVGFTHRMSNLESACLPQ
jgi:hypothetical protein